MHSNGVTTNQLHNDNQTLSIKSPAFFRCLLLLVLLLSGTVSAKPRLKVGIGYSDPISGSKEGAANLLDTLLSYRLLTELGYDVQFVVAPYSKLTQLLLQHKIDIAARQSGQLLPALYYTLPYVEFHYQVFTLSTSGIELSATADLAHYKMVSFQNARNVLGTEFQQLANRAPDYQEVFDHSQAVRLLLKGRTQLLIIDTQTFYRRLQQLGAQQKQIRSFDLLPKVQYSFGVYDRELQYQMDLLLQQWQESGHMERLRQEARLSGAQIEKLLRSHQS